MTSDRESELLLKAKYAAYEIIDTEKTYLSRLEAIQNVYISNLEDLKIIDSNDFELQFGCWGALLDICQRFYSNLETQRNEQHPQVGKIIYEFCEDPDFCIYQVYLVKFESALNRRAVLMTTNRKFSQFVTDAQSDSRTFGFTIESLLIEPVARVPRYCLLLEQLIKYTPKESDEYNLLTKSLIKIKSITSENNEAIQKRENKEKIMSIMMNFESKTRVNLLDDNDRHFIREGTLDRQCRRHKKEFMFWLFSDKLLYGELSSSSAFSRSHHYTLHRVINLNETCLVHDVHVISEKPENAFMIMSKSKSFIIWAENTDEKASWCKDIDTAITNLQTVGKFNHHTKYAPVWIPDAFVQTCMECDVSFTTLRRKHHCRLCGSIVCNDCSKNRIFAENIDQHHEVRVCNTCMSKTVTDDMIINLNPSEIDPIENNTTATTTTTTATTVNVTGTDTISLKPSSPTVKWIASKVIESFSTKNKTPSSSPTSHSRRPSLSETTSSLTKNITSPSSSCSRRPSLTDTTPPPPLSLSSKHNSNTYSMKRRPSLSETRHSLESVDSTTTTTTTTRNRFSLQRLSSFSRGHSPATNNKSRRHSSNINDSNDLKLILSYRNTLLDQIYPNRMHELSSKKRYITAEKILLENTYFNHNENMIYPLDIFEQIINGNSIQKVDSDGEYMYMCRLCEGAFNMFRIKHTCSNCGSNVCGECSQKKFMIPYIDVKHPVRVCDDCYTVLSHGIVSTYEPSFREMTSMKARRSQSPTRSFSRNILDDSTHLHVNRENRSSSLPSIYNSSTSIISHFESKIDPLSESTHIYEERKSEKSPTMDVEFKEDGDEDEDEVDYSIRKQYYRDLSPVKRIQMLSRELREASKDNMPLSPTTPPSTTTNTTTMIRNDSPPENSMRHRTNSFINTTLTTVMSMKNLNIGYSTKTNMTETSYTTNNRMSDKRISADRMERIRGTNRIDIQSKQSTPSPNLLISNNISPVSYPYEEDIYKESYEERPSNKSYNESLSDYSGIFIDAQDTPTTSYKQNEQSNKLTSPSNRMNLSPKKFTLDIGKFFSSSPINNNNSNSNSSNNPQVSSLSPKHSLENPSINEESMVDISIKSDLTMNTQRIPISPSVILHSLTSASLDTTATQYTHHDPMNKDNNNNNDNNSQTEIEIDNNKKSNYTQGGSSLQQHDPIYLNRQHISNQNNINHNINTNSDHTTSSSSSHFPFTLFHSLPSLLNTSHQPQIKPYIIDTTTATTTTATIGKEHSQQSNSNKYNDIRQYKENDLYASSQLSLLVASSSSESKYIYGIDHHHSNNNDNDNDNNDDNISEKSDASSHSSVYAWSHYEI